MHQCTPVPCKTSAAKEEELRVESCGSLQKSIWHFYTDDGKSRTWLFWLVFHEVLWPIAHDIPWLWHFVVLNFALAVSNVVCWFDGCDFWPRRLYAGTTALQETYPLVSQLYFCTNHSLNDFHLLSSTPTVAGPLRMALAHPRVHGGAQLARRLVKSQSPLFLGTAAFRTDRAKTTTSDWRLDAVDDPEREHLKPRHD